MYFYHICLLFLVVFCGVFKVFHTMVSMNSESFAFFFAIWMPFISLSCLIALAKTSNTILDKSDESGHPCLVPDFGGIGFGSCLLSASPICSLDAVPMHLQFCDELRAA